MRRFGVFAVTLTLVAGVGAAPIMAQEKLTLGMSGATWMLALHAALVKGLFAEEGLNVQGMRVQGRQAVEQGKTHPLWVGTDKGLTEADFGYLEMDLLPNMAAGKIDYYIVDGMNFGWQELMVAPDSALKSAADLKGKTIAIGPAWTEPYRPATGPTFVWQELKAAGLDPTKDVTLIRIPWEALPKLDEYVTEGFKTGKFDAVVSGEPDPLTLRGQKRVRPLFTQTYQAPYNQEYCCLFGIKRALVDSQPDRAALILRAFRRAKQWVAQNPTTAVIAAQATGHYAASNPIQPSANVVQSFGYDRQVDLAEMLERAFQDRINSGAIQVTVPAKELVRLHYRKIQ